MKRTLILTILFSLVATNAGAQAKEREEDTFYKALEVTYFLGSMYDDMFSLSRDVSPRFSEKNPLWYPFCEKRNGKYEFSETTLVVTSFATLLTIEGLRQVKKKYPKTAKVLLLALALDTLYTGVYLNTKLYIKFNFGSVNR